MDPGFKPLLEAEFDALPIDEKVKYLKMAMKAQGMTIFRTAAKRSPDTTIDLGLKK
jgi:hypothetical protein